MLVGQGYYSPKGEQFQSLLQPAALLMSSLGGLACAGCLKACSSTVAAQPLDSDGIFAEAAKQKKRFHAFKLGRDSGKKKVAKAAKNKV